MQRVEEGPLPLLMEHGTLHRRRSSAHGPPFHSLAQQRRELWSVPGNLPGVPPNGPTERPLYQSIGIGTYGCVVKKPLPCSPKGQVAVPVHADVVGKVYMDPENALDRPAAEEAEDEWLESQRIAELDPEHKFTPHVYGACVVDNAALQHLHGCPAHRLRPARQPRVELIMDSGGQDWSTVAWTSPDALLHSVRTVLEGLRILLARSVVHNDIKPSNILYNQATGKTQIIDFGLTTTFVQAFDVANLGAEYEYWPPEQAMIAALRDTAHTADAQAFENWSPRLMEQLVQIGLRRRRLSALASDATAHSDRWTQQLTNLVTQFVRFVPSPLNINALRSTYELMLPEHDVYGLGVSLHRLLYERKGAITDKFTSVEDLQAMAWRMSEPSPLQRMSVDAALHSVEQLLDIRRAKRVGSEAREVVVVPMDIGWQDYHRLPQPTI